MLASRQLAGLDSVITLSSRTADNTAVQPTPTQAVNSLTLTDKYPKNKTHVLACLSCDLPISLLTRMQATSVALQTVSIRSSGSTTLVCQLNLQLELIDFVEFGIFCEAVRSLAVVSPLGNKTLIT